MTMTHSRDNSEFDNFDRTMRALVKVPRSEIKAQLDAEKTEKAKRPKKRGRPIGSTVSSSGRVLGGKD
jgi:hypothetical protein